QLKVCRFGDNMREVAVTDGDKVAAQIKFGFSVNTWAVGDLVQQKANMQRNWAWAACLPGLSIRTTACWLTPCVKVWVMKSNLK
ncbi:hypothetical protein MJI12_27610, partial [Salmonella enterica subsp. enterica serovar Kentucky]|nr:hypothetical protein [Salmonella enterica subsp. enterica serovar Kentucky]